MSRTDTILEALASVLPEEGFKPLHEPFFRGNEWNYVKDCIDTGWVSTAGKYVNQFEESLQEYTGARRAVAVANGTAALHIALLLAGVKSGDEVIIPALTFVATANAVAYAGGIPHMADSESVTLGMDAGKLGEYLEKITIRTDKGCVNRKTGRRIAAVVPMHTFGHPADIEGLVEVCERFDIPMVEDAAESLGSTYKGRHTGLFGRVGTLSFNGNKTITTGGGGAILTDDRALGDMAKHLTTTAKVPHKWEYVHDHVGYNYRMPNINAALGCAQMEALPDYLRRKRILAEKYAAALNGVDGVSFVTEPCGCTSNYWLNALKLAEPDMVLRDEILEKTNAAGIMTRPAWTLMHKLSMYEACPRMDLFEAEKLEKQLINIPSSACLIQD